MIVHLAKDNGISDIVLGKFLQLFTLVVNYKRHTNVGVIKFLGSVFWL